MSRTRHVAARRVVNNGPARGPPAIPGRLTQLDASAACAAPHTCRTTSIKMELNNGT